MKKISVIVPVYNAEKSIERCINSIINQTYSNLEILVINDGSTDSTLDVLNELHTKDSRVIIFTVPNGGVSRARNFGLEKMSGDLVTFVDSDDYIDETMYEQLVCVMDKYNCDISHCGYSNVNNDKIISFTGENNGKVIVQNVDEALECLISGKLFSGGIWNKLYRVELFQGIKFVDEIRFNEDVLINYYLFKKAIKSVFIDKALYNYVANFYGATHSADAVKMGEDCKLVADIIEKDCRDTSYHFAAQYKKAYNAIVLYRAYLYENNNENRNKRKMLLEEIKQFKKAGVYSSKNDKISVYLFIYSPFLYRIIYRIYDKVRVKKLDPT